MAGSPAPTSLKIMAAAGLILLGAVAWDHLGSTQLQRIGADQACAQVAQQVDHEVHTFKSGYPGGIGDMSNAHMKITAVFKCGDAEKQIEQWDDARGARLSNGHVMQGRQVKSMETLDLMNWRKERARPEISASAGARVASGPGQ